MINHKLKAEDKGFSVAIPHDVFEKKLKKYRFFITEFAF